MSHCINHALNVCEELACMYLLQHQEILWSVLLYSTCIPITDWFWKFCLLSRPTCLNFSAFSLNYTTCNNQIHNFFFEIHHWLFVCLLESWVQLFTWVNPTVNTFSFDLQFCLHNFEIQILTYSPCLSISSSNPVITRAEMGLEILSSLINENTAISSSLKYGFSYRFAEVVSGLPSRFWQL